MNRKQIAVFMTVIMLTVQLCTGWTIAEGAEPMGPFSAADQLQGVTAYYNAMDPSKELSAPMEGVARFALGAPANSGAFPSQSVTGERYNLCFVQPEEEYISNKPTIPMEKLFYTPKGINTQTWLSQMILDLLAVGEDPGNYEGHNYVYELMQYQKANGNGIFANEGKAPGAADGLAMLALKAYWGDRSWPLSEVEKMGQAACINSMVSGFATISNDVSKLDYLNFIGINNKSGIQWGLGKGIPPVSKPECQFYNNFWLSQGLALYGGGNTGAADKVRIIYDTFAVDGVIKFKTLRKNQCELQAAYLITALSAGQQISDDEWQILKSFQMEDGSYKRKTGDTVRNAEATAMAAIALDYGNRIALGEDKTTCSAFARLRYQGENLDAEKGSVEAVFKDVAELEPSIKNEKDLKTLFEIIKKGGSNGSTVTFASSEPNIISPEDPELHLPANGEPDTLVELKVLIKSGNAVGIVRTGKYLLESEDKTFPFQHNFDLLKKYYLNYKNINGVEGLEWRGNAVSVASLMDDPALGGVKYNTAYYGTDGGYFSETLCAPEAWAIIDQLAMKKNPREYPCAAAGTGEVTSIDLIQSLLDKQSEKGFFSNSYLTSTIEDILALEAFSGGGAWGNEAAGTKRGRVGAIEYLLGNMQNCELISGGRSLDKIWTQPENIDGATKTVIDQDTLIPQCEMVLLLSRWMKDETPVTVSGKTEPLKDVAQREMTGLLTTLKGICDCNYVDMGEDTPVRGFEDSMSLSRYISALVASGNKDLVNEYKLWDRLRNARNRDGSYSNNLYALLGSTFPKNTAAVAMAMGDYRKGQAILTSLSYDVSSVTDEEAVAQDLAGLRIDECVIKNITLAGKGFYGSKIAWSSSNADVIDPVSGMVNRPAKGQPDAIVTLAAEASRGSQKQVRTFCLRVIAEGEAGQEAAEADWRELTIPLFVTGGSISLPSSGSHGSSITWTSSNVGAISTDGRVTSGAQDADVVLTATIMNGTFSRTKEFTIWVSKTIDESNVVEKAMAQLRAGYNTERSLTGAYWDIFAAKSVLSDHFGNYNFKVYDVKNHRKSSAWQGTDYGAVVLQILAQGDNPYNYQGSNYVKLLQQYVDKNWGSFGSPIFAAMALDAAAADPEGHKYDRNGISGFFIGQMQDLQYGPDLAGWSLIPLATRINEDEKYRDEKILPAVDQFKSALKKSQEKSGVNKGLFNTGGMEGGILTLSNGCVVSGFTAMQAAGLQGFDLTKTDWKINGTGVLEAIYEKDIKNKENISDQLILEFGDVYYGDSVWRRVGVKPEQFAALIDQAKPLVETGSGIYTEKSYKDLKNAYDQAVSVKGNHEKMSKNYFGQAHFALKDAIEGLKEKGTITVQIFGDEGKSTILDTTSVKEKGSVLAILQKASLENKISLTVKDNAIKELGGIIPDGIGAWYCYQAAADSDAARITEPLNNYTPVEGTKLIFKYCKDTKALPDHATLNEHLVHDAAQALTITGAIDNSGNVTGNLILAGSGLYSTSVSWMPNKLFAIKEDGKVTRDPKEDIPVILTAKVSLGGKYAERQFIVLVKSQSGSTPTEPEKKKAYISVVGPVGTGKVFFKRTALEIEAGETAFSLLEKTGLALSVDKNTQYGVYVRGIEGLSEFDEGPESGWMYRVNGDFPGHSAALERIKNGDYVEWVYTRNLGRDVGGYIKGVENSSKDGTAAVKNGTVTATTSAEAKTDSSGKATAAVSAKDLSSTLAKVLEAVRKAEKEGKKEIKAEVKIDVKTDNNATSVETTVPASSLKEVAKADNTVLSVATAIGNISFDNKALSAISAEAAAAEVKISVAEVDQSKVTLADKLTNLTRPVFELKVTSGGKTISDFKGGTAVISLPYTLGKGEKAENICIYFIDEKGNANLVQGAKYDEKTKTVTFTTTHFSYYAIGYDDKMSRFTDVKSTDWFAEYVSILVSKGIIKGKTETAFAPKDPITRAEFVQILYGMAQAEAGTTGSAVTSGAVSVDETKAAETFKDVKASDWYAKAVAWAYENHVVSGRKATDGTLNFAPNQTISRQDMAVMIVNYAEKVTKKPVTGTNKAAAFPDDAKISSYARESVSKMQQAGIINGINQKDSYGNAIIIFAPLNNATRAEAAAMIAKLLK